MLILRPLCLLLASFVAAASLVAAASSCCAQTAQPQTAQPQTTEPQTQSAAAPDQPSVFSDHPIRRATPQEIDDAIRTRDYRPVLKEELLNSPQTRDARSQPPTSNDIVRATYIAVLENTDQLNGDVRLEFSKSQGTRRRLGQTNLQNLQFVRDQQKFTLGQTANLETVVLVPETLDAIDGYWTKKGNQHSETLTFELQLPVAVMQEFELITPAEIIVTSANSLVQNAGAIEGSEQESNRWVLFPADNGRLTINCSSRVTSSTTSDRRISSSVDYSVRSDDGQARWNLNLPGIPQHSEFSLQFSSEFTPRLVFGPGQRALPFTWEPSENRLTVTNPTFASLTALVISGPFPQPTKGGSILPILTGGHWTDPASKTQGELKLSSGILRANFSAELSVQQSDLVGLMETDVEFAADGSQRLTIEQFQSAASAHFSLLIPDPVLQEDVVTRSTGEPGQIEVFIRIENRAGVANTLQYDIPKKYRVTAVRELETQLSLLFRTLPASSSAATQPIRIYLRSPMARNSRQLIQIQLQSTSNEVNLREASLTNPDYLRLSDVLAVNPEQLPAELSKTQAVEDSKSQTTYPWLPDGVSKAILFDRSQFPENIRTSFESNEITASINHSLAVANSMIRETYQIDFNGTPRLPREVIIQASDTAELQLTASNLQLGFRLQRSTSRRSQSEWILSLPDVAPRTELSVTLECERAVSGQSAPMLIQMPGITRRLAAIRLVPPDDNWDLLDPNGQPVSGTIAYPVRPLDSAFRIQIKDSNPATRQVHGMATWLLENQADEMRAAVLIRLSAFGLSERLSLSLSSPISQRCLCLVNQHQLDVAIKDGSVQILLPATQNQTDIQLLISGIAIPLDEKSEFQIPHIDVRNVAQQRIDTTVVPPTGLQVVARDQTSAIRIKHATENPSISSLQAITPSTGIQHFLTRLALRQRNVDSLVLSPTLQSSFYDLQLQQSSVPLIRSVIIAVGLILIITVLIPAGAVSWTVTGIGILVAQIIGIAYPEPAYLSPILTTAFATAGVLTQLLRHHSIHAGLQPSNAHPKTGFVLRSLLAGLFVAGMTTAAYGQEDILIPDNNSPIVFAPASLLPPQSKSNLDVEDSILILDSHVAIRLLNKTSVATTVTCQIAVDPSIDHLFELPVDDVTLVDCELDQSPVLPLKSAAAAPSIRIAAMPEPSPMLDRDQPVIAATSANWVAGLQVHEIRYTVRMIARPDVLGIKADIPVPAAPLTKISVRDTTESVAGVELLIPEPVPGVRLGNEFNFPILSSVSQIELQMQFSRSAIDRKQRPQSSGIVARIMALPNTLKITSHCELSPVDAKSEAVRIARMPNMTLVRVESDDGAAITPLIDQDYVEIPISVDRQGFQKFRCEWQQSLPLQTDITIDTKSLRQLNRIPADRLVIIAGTSDRFTIDSVRSQQTPLAQIAEGQTSFTPALRTTESAYLISEQDEAVSIRLVRPLDTREASLKQRAIVETNHIQWTCECALHLPEEPIFRQHLTVSEDLKIQSVSARSQEIDRLQSWYRDGDQVVVCLREATRGALTLTIKGMLPRPTQTDTALPVVTLPESVEILESSLEISATKPEDVFLRSLGGAHPDSLFEIDTVAVPTTPLRLTVTDELRPMIVRPAPQRSANANVVALISDQNHQTQMTILMALQAVESPFNLPLTTPSNVAYATSRLFFLASEGSVTELNNLKHSIPITAKGSIDDNDVSVVVYTGIVPAMTSDVFSLPLPTFGNPCTIKSLSVLDSRDGNGITTVPRWVRTILTDLPESSSPGNPNSLPATLNESESQISIRLPSSPTGVEKEISDHQPTYAVTTHRLGGDTCSVRGSTGILTFAPAANAILNIVVPDQCNLLQVRLNGTEAPFSSTDSNQIAVTVNTRICFVELDWLQPVPANNVLRSSRLPLPTPVNVEGRLLIDPKLPLPYWRLREKSANKIDFPDLLTEITSGLQRIGTARVPPDSTPPEIQNQQMTPLTESPVWVEFQTQSAAAAEACVGFFSKVSDASGKLDLVALETAEPTIEIRQKLSLSTILTILAAACMLVAGLTTQSTQKRKALKLNVLAKKPNHAEEHSEAEQQLSASETNQPPSNKSSR